jgi:hypothetical protein
MYREPVMIRTNLRDKYNAMDLVQKTGVETMAIGVARKWIRLIAIRKPDHVVNKPRPTSSQGSSELQEVVTNLTN